MKKAIKNGLKDAGMFSWEFISSHKGWRWLLIGLVVGFAAGAAFV